MFKLECNQNTDPPRAKHPSQMGFIASNSLREGRGLWAIKVHMSKLGCNPFSTALSKLKDGLDEILKVLLICLQI